MDQVRPAKVPFSLRIERDKLDRLRQIADRNNRTIVGHIRQLIDNELADEGGEDGLMSTEKVARYLAVDGDAVEAIVVSPDDFTDAWKVEINIGYADLLIADMLVSEEIALGIAHAIDIVFRCGVYTDGDLR